MLQLSIRINEKKKDALDKKLAKYGWTAQWLMNKMIDTFLEDYNEEPFKPQVIIPRPPRNREGQEGYKKWRNEMYPDIKDSQDEGSGDADRGTSK